MNTTPADGHRPSCHDLVGALTQNDRRAAYAALALGATTVAEVAERAGLRPRPKKHDAYWAQWAVPSAITRADSAGHHKTIAQTHARMHQRVRDRLPRLPLLVETAERVLRVAAAPLEAARATPSTRSSTTTGRTTCGLSPRPTGCPAA
ncbi:hypothetical protein [Streptosporangium canum]|uniref:hypothetical protein n=1 Tax=Streptosporangium canum TaxID=324952 RepID=UPI00378AB252